MYKDNFVVAVKCNDNILREHGSTVYLPFNTNYSILLKNKDSRKALVTIEIDGEDVLNHHGLIMSGNDSHELKGFMRDMNLTNRFKFINKTKEIQDYRGDKIDDGLLRVTYNFVAPPVKSYEPKYLFSYGDCRIKGDTVYRAGAVSCCSSAPAIDEGITVKGESISQSYNYGNIGNLSSEKHVIILQLKGRTKIKKTTVKKPLTVVNKIRCETCGRKNKSSNKFCYNCGTCLA